MHFCFTLFFLSSFHPICNLEIFFFLFVNNVYVCRRGIFLDTEGQVNAN